VRRVLIPFLVLALACAPPTPVDRALQKMRMNDPDAAKQLLEADLAEHPDDLAARKLLVRVEGFRGDLDAARAQVDQIAKRLPAGDPTPWIELGHAYELAHRFEEALAAYDEAAARAPTSPAGPREGGMRAARWGEADAARPRLEEAVRRGANDSETFHALGLVLVHLKDWDGAVAAYQNGIKANPDDDTNVLGLATVAVARGDGAAALAAYDRLVAKNPRWAAGELGRAWALGKLGRKKEALAALVRAEELGAPKSYVDKQRAELAPSP
jgi:tetratricopeptide (TPR) repeat protein